MEKLAISVDEMAKTLGVSRPVAYELTRREGFPVIRVSDRRIVIPVDGLKAWLQQQQNYGYEGYLT